MGLSDNEVASGESGNLRGAFVLVKFIIRQAPNVMNEYK